MDIAIFGGSFNPVHNGHILNARNVCREFKLDRVLFVPSRQPVHKTWDYEPGKDHRARMLEIALADYDNMELSRIELDRKEPSFSILTVGAVEKQYRPDNLFFILGTDAFNTLPSWKSYGELVRKVCFIVMTRPGDVISEEVASVIPELRRADNGFIDISSTQLRMMLKEKKDCTEYMDRAVLDYIIREGLYCL